MDDKQLEQLAIELRRAYFEDVNPSEEWSTLGKIFKEQWMNVARFVVKRDADYLKQTIRLIHPEDVR